MPKPTEQAIDNLNAQKQALEDRIRDLESSKAAKQEEAQGKRDIISNLETRQKMLDELEQNLEQSKTDLQDERTASEQEFDSQQKEIREYYAPEFSEDEISMADPNYLIEISTDIEKTQQLEGFLKSTAEGDPHKGKADEFLQIIQNSKKLEKELDGIERFLKLDNHEESEHNIRVGIKALFEKSTDPGTVNKKTTFTELIEFAERSEKAKKANMAEEAKKATELFENAMTQINALVDNSSLNKSDKEKYKKYLENFNKYCTLLANNKGNELSEELNRLKRELKLEKKLMGAEHNIRRGIKALFEKSTDQRIVNKETTFSYLVELAEKAGNAKRETELFENAMTQINALVDNSNLDDTNKETYKEYLEKFKEYCTLLEDKKENDLKFDTFCRDFKGVIEQENKRREAHNEAMFGKLPSIDKILENYNDEENPAYKQGTDVQHLNRIITISSKIKKSREDIVKKYETDKSTSQDEAKPVNFGSENAPNFNTQSFGNTKGSTIDIKSIGELAALQKKNETARAGLFSTKNDNYYIRKMIRDLIADENKKQSESNKKPLLKTFTDLEELSKTDRIEFLNQMARIKNLITFDSKAVSRKETKTITKAEAEAFINSFIEYGKDVSVFESTKSEFQDLIQRENANIKKFKTTAEKAAHDIQEFKSLTSKEGRNDFNIKTSKGVKDKYVKKVDEAKSAHRTAEIKATTFNAAESAFNEGYKYSKILAATLILSQGKGALKDAKAILVDLETRLEQAKQGKKASAQNTARMIADSSEEKGYDYRLNLNKAARRKAGQGDYDDYIEKLTDKLNEARAQYDKAREDLKTKAEFALKEVVGQNINIEIDDNGKITFKYTQEITDKAQLDFKTRQEAALKLENPKERDYQLQVINQEWRAFAEKEAEEKKQVAEIIAEFNKAEKGSDILKYLYTENGKKGIEILVNVVEKAVKYVTGSEGKDKIDAFIQSIGKSDDTGNTESKDNPPADSKESEGSQGAESENQEGIDLNIREKLNSLGESLEAANSPSEEADNYIVDQIAEMSKSIMNLLNSIKPEIEEMVNDAQMEAQSAKETFDRLQYTLEAYNKEIDKGKSDSTSPLFLEVLESERKKSLDASNERYAAEKQLLDEKGQIIRDEREKAANDLNTAKQEYDITNQEIQAGDREIKTAREELEAIEAQINALEAAVTSESTLNEETEVTNQGDVGAPSNEETEATNQGDVEAPSNEETEVTNQDDVAAPSNEETEVTNQGDVAAPSNEETEVTNQGDVAAPSNEETEVTNQGDVAAPSNEEREETNQSDLETVQNTVTETEATAEAEPEILSGKNEINLDSLSNENINGLKVISAITGKPITEDMSADEMIKAVNTIQVNGIGLYQMINMQNPVSEVNKADVMERCNDLGEMLKAGLQLTADPNANVSQSRFEADIVKNAVITVENQQGMLEPLKLKASENSDPQVTAAINSFNRHNEIMSKDFNKGRRDAAKAEHDESKKQQMSESERKTNNRRLSLAEAIKISRGKAQPYGVARKTSFNTSGPEASRENQSSMGNGKK